MTANLRQVSRYAMVGTVLVTAAVAAGAVDRSGREVVASVCAACHADGKEGAPKIGDFAAWVQRAQVGFGTLSEHAMSGTSKMPARGGRSDLTDLEMTRAIAFMVSGGLASDPSKPYKDVKTIEGDELVKSHCISCHGPGANGAPRLSEFSDWKPRLTQGVEGLVRSAVAGHNKMPSRAGLPGLTDVDLRNAVTYMIVHSVPSKAASR